MTDLITRPQPSTSSPPPAADRPYEPPPDPPAGQPPDHRPRRTGRRIAAVTAAVVLVLGAGTAGGLVATELWGSPAASSSTATATATITQLSDVVDLVSPSVVTVTVSVRGGPVEGSGVIVSGDGQVLTNYHVVENSFAEVSVQLSDGRTATAQVVRADQASDLALLQLDGIAGLTAAILGDSGTLSVGDTVLAFGSPLGLEGSVTAGIVSALDREADELGLTGLIQTDAPINSGNSGGPLVDAAGRVVGINVANATTDGSGGSVGLGFSIPIDDALVLLS